MAERRGARTDRVRRQIEKLVNDLTTLREEWEYPINRDLIDFATQLLKMAHTGLGKIRLEAVEEEEELLEEAEAEVEEELEQGSAS